MKIRKAETKDAPLISQIQLESWKKTYNHFIPENILNSLSYEARLSTWKNIIKDGSGRISVAEENLVVSGFIHLSQTEANSIEIIRLYVAPDKMRCGIGTLLFEDAHGYFRQGNFACIFLWVAEENVIGRQFYESKGFKLIPGKSRIDSFSVDGSPPIPTRNKTGNPDPKLGEFKEVYYQLEI